MDFSNKQRKIWAEYKNGNISDFKSDINKLSKKELIDFIYNGVNDEEINTGYILSVIYKYLEA